MNGTKEIMTIEEAIKHAEEVANVYEEMTNDYALDSVKLHKCANEHRQLAAWLKELLEYKGQPKIIYCKECKHCKATEFSTGRKGFMCMKWILETDPNWYCARAERKTE